MSQIYIMNSKSKDMNHIKEYDTILACFCEELFLYSSSMIIVFIFCLSMNCYCCQSIPSYLLSLSNHLRDWLYQEEYRDAIIFLLCIINLNGDLFWFCYIVLMSEGI